MEDNDNTDKQPIDDGVNDKPVDAKPAKRTAKSTAGSSRRAPDVVLVAYRGDAPHAVGSGKDLLILRPGLNEIDGRTWSSHAGHPGIAARLPSESKDDDPGPLAGSIVVLPGVPRRGDALFDLIARTVSLEGLAAIESAESALYGDTPRATVMGALAKARRLLAKRGLA